MSRVIVSAGHTSAEPGITVDGLEEVTFTRKIASEVVSLLRNKGVITLAVPYELELTERINWVNRTGYSESLNDIALEIHINDGGKSGVEAWYEGDGNNASKKLANVILDSIKDKTGLQIQGAKSELNHTLGKLAFIHRTKPTAIILECLYLDNKSDQAFLKDPSNIILLADGIASGVVSHFSDQNDLPKDKPMIQEPRPFQPPSLDFGPGMGNFGTDHMNKRKVIEDNFRLILGRNPTFHESNYFRNNSTSQELLIKKIIESQEHVDLVNNAQKIKEKDKELDTLQKSVAELKLEVKDRDQIIENMDFLIEQKNASIQKLEHPTIEPVPTSSSSTSKQPQPNQQEVYYKESLLDKFLEFFNRIFG